MKFVKWRVFVSGKVFERVEKVQWVRPTNLFLGVFQFMLEINGLVWKQFDFVVKFLL